MDGDEYCRITIDSITNSYKIDAPARPHNLQGKKLRSASHSLLTPQYMEGKSIIKQKENRYKFIYDDNVI